MVPPHSTGATPLGGEANSPWRTGWGECSGVPIERERQRMWNSAVIQSVTRLASFDKRRREYKRLGWVYAARNPCFADPVLKVGQTKVSPVTRIEQLSGSTSVYRPFELVYFVHVSDRDKAEGFAHQALQNSRVNLGKEFFEAPLIAVVKVLDEAARRWQIPLGRTPRAGFLQPALGKRIVPCPRCGARNRLPQLIVDISVTCMACCTPYKLITDVPNATNRM